MRGQSSRNNKYRVHHISTKMTITLEMENKMGKDIWLSNDFLKWNVSLECSTSVSEHLWKRSYDIWDRACFLIEKSNNQFDLSDGIANLKRSLNHRLSLIENIYHLKNINFSDKPKGYLELLEYYGLVRPFIMKNILLIRNDIEHNDAEPPELSRCKELIDVVWYFLKSTDSLVQRVGDSFNFCLYDNNGEETNYWLSIDIDYTQGTVFGISGWVPCNMISFEKKDSFFLVHAEKIHSKGEFSNLENHQDKLSTDKWITGGVNKDNIDYENVIKKVLIAY